MSPDKIEPSVVNPGVVSAVADVLGAGDPLKTPRKPHLEQVAEGQTRPIFDTADSGRYATLKDGREMSW